MCPLYKILYMYMCGYVCLYFISYTKIFTWAKLNSLSVNLWTCMIFTDLQHHLTSNTFLEFKNKTLSLS